MIFDTWGGALTPDHYRRFSLAYVERIRAALIRENEGRPVPVILFTKGGGAWLEAMAASGVDCLGLDWTCDPAAARRRVGERVALQGNLDPIALQGPPEAIHAEVHDVLEAFGPAPGHVFNLGHGVTPDTDPAHVAALVDAVHAFGRAGRA